MKAADPVMLEVTTLVSYADYLLVLTATGRPHAQALTDRLKRRAKELGSPLVSEEGTDVGKWALVDFGDVVVHIFQQAERAYYDLETLWIEAERIDIPGAEHAPTMQPFAS